MRSMKNVNVNAYALADGTAVNLPDHCRDCAERFEMADGSLVWAVRVGVGTVESAARLAAELPAPRRPR